jgi:peptidoglycan/LPS O-acetylase OafA/YrhL
LLGFVNSLKPISLARSGKHDVASSKLSASAFSRVLRLVLPATIATIFSWMLCQFGLYTKSLESDAFWLMYNTPAPSPNVFAAMVDLKKALVDTWSLGSDNAYDQPQWALVHLLQGSFMTIMVLLMTIRMTPGWRTLLVVILTFISLDWSTHIADRKSVHTMCFYLLTIYLALVGFTCFMGVALAELSMSSLAQTLAPFSSIISPFVALFGLVLMSYPNSNPSTAPWSASMMTFGRAHFGNHELERVYGSAGGVLLIAAIIISPYARSVLSKQPLKWLGKVSFAIYLVHGTVMRTVFAWALWLGSKKQDVDVSVSHSDEGGWEIYQTANRYLIPGATRCFVATCVLLLATLLASHLWSSKIEPFCAKTSGVVEKLVQGQLLGVNTQELLPSKNDEKSLLPTRRD